MAVIAIVDGSPWDQSVVEHAAWAATSTGQPLLLVTPGESSEPDQVFAYDAYQEMNPQKDLFRELSSRSHANSSERDSAAVDIVQAAARRAKDLGVKRVRTAIATEPLPWYIENLTDSGDLVVIARHDRTDSSSRPWLDQFLKMRRRVMLLVPETFSAIHSWLIAIDGKPPIGRAVDYLTDHRLLHGGPGTAVFVGSDYQNRRHFRDAVKHLDSAGHTITSHELQGNADDILGAVLAVSPVDLLVMGAYGQGRFRNLIERSTTSRLLDSFRGPVLVARA